MRAITQQRFGGPEVLEVADVPRPEPLPTEVLVRVVAAGINPVDAKTREGSGMAGVLGAPPFILGWDVSGVVEKTGHGVHTLQPGDEVYGMPWFPRQAGAYAEYVTAPSRQFARRPVSISHEAAAAVPLAGLTAWQSLTAATTIKPGQRVLIHAAAGGVGHFAVQIAKHLGAYVIGTARSAKHDWLRSLGADELIDYSTVAFDSAVKDVDVVLDLVGDEQTGLRSLSTLTPGGLLIAVPSGVAPSVFDAAQRDGKRAVGFLVEPDGTALTEIAQLIDAGAVHVEVAEAFPLERAADAHRALETGRTRGKLVLTI
ncbi:NADPH:quinone reductase-like Zn-dependent oxidoreductase [Actinoplanes lutulentus]|uniref:NADPH:quinone reductase-like Zn-dependent oxidoreductase n=1 Tax=Actinoplanes lutulentus TaxID=1287878 RepID=A0A327Z440_9ACTN|nr:NADP-dependent oxidoreductase [Actinoplanes lutulentus]MBB2948604.1 NADPH:quinone reductase-like Zn-dependent oxidoreductase [Actinoplanes lutulentus]RAK28025.1 NADPH:quinone reductase-like Zn-dependent oxidoreductase [Actinoplanes lutulentus]